MLDASVKKNGTFIKKLRQLGADNAKQLAAEAARLNLSKVGGGGIQCAQMWVGCVWKREGGQ
jgi:hypothetical protein